MSQTRRGPSIGGLLLVLMLVGPLLFSAWWFTHPSPPAAPPGPPLDDLDIVCTGRADAENLVVPLDVSVPGRIVKLEVKEGDSVRKGQLILAVEDAPYRIGAASATAAVRGAEIEVEIVTKRAAQFPATITVKEKQYAAAVLDADAADAKVAQLKDQMKLSSTVTKADLEYVEAGAKKLRLVAEAAKIDLDETKKYDPQLEVRAVKAKLAAAQAELDRANRGVEECVLSAPADGTILKLQAAVGGSIAPGSMSVVFAPAGPVVVRAEMEQGGLSRVREGQHVEIRDEMQVSGPVWTGKVKRIAGWVAPRRNWVLEPGELNDVRTTEVVVEIAPSSHKLLIGQRVQVRIKPKG